MWGRQIFYGLCSYKEKKVWCIAIISTLVILLGILLLDDRLFIKTVIQSSFIAQPVKVIAQSIIGRIAIAPVNFVLAFIIASLAGLLIAAYYKAFTVRMQSKKAGLAGGLGALLGILGIGCASCGPTILVSIIALATGQSIALLIARNTAIIYLVSIGILLLSLGIMLNEIGKSHTCKI